MRLKKVKPELIVIPEVRVTSQFDPEVEEMLKTSMATDGLVAPIICVEVIHDWPEIHTDKKTGKSYGSDTVKTDIVLVDGFHRLMEAIKLKWPTIEVALVEGTMVDVLTRNMYLDHIRGKHPVMDMIKVISTLWKEYQMDSEKIAEKTGLKRDYIEKLQVISELTPWALQCLEENKIGITKIWELTRIQDPVKQEVALQVVLMHNWTVKEVAGYVDDILTAMQPPPPPGEQPAPQPMPKLRCAFCQGEYEVQQLSNPNICVTCTQDLAYLKAVQRQQEAQEAKQAQAKEAPHEETESLPETQTSTK